MTLFGKIVDINDGNITLNYDDYENVTDGYESVEQYFDASSNEWGEIERHFVSCWSEG